MYDLNRLLKQQNLNLITNWWTSSSIGDKLRDISEPFASCRYFNEGFIEGFNEGFKEGFKKCFKEDFEEGFNEGFKEGFNEGSKEGFK